MDKILKFMRHYKGLMIAIVLSCLACLWSFGCESKVLSTADQGVMVTRAELQLEVDTFVSMIELKIADLDKQDAIKQELFRIGIVIAESGVDVLNPVGVAVNIIGLLGFGLIYDNSKKDALSTGKPTKNK